MDLGRMHLLRGIVRAALALALSDYFCSVHTGSKLEGILMAAFTYSPASPSTGQAVQFTDASTGSPTSWNWAFGDGSTSTAQNPSHTYTTAGSQTVTLTATNSSGSTSVNKAITVSESGTSYSLPADRSIEWSSVGVPGGMTQYRDGGANARPVGVNVANYGAVGNGVTSCTTAFKNAQAACPANKVIYIPDGTYLISGSVNVYEDITWRGQSTAGTIIKMNGVFDTNSEWPGPQPTVIVTAGATKGSNTLTVNSVSGTGSGISSSSPNSTPTTSITARTGGPRLG